MKQIFSFGLTAALLLACLTGCGGQAGSTSAADVDIWEESGDGRGRYEGDLFLDGMKYEFEIDPQTGRIIDWNADLRD